MISSMSRANSKVRRKDFVLYIAISSAVILFLVVCTLNGMSYQWIITWIATAFIFVSIVVVSRREWSPALWLFLAVAFAIHVLCLPAIVAYLYRLPHRAGHFVIAGCLIEYAVLLFARNLLLLSRRSID
jgi:heme O synthase-like polyprenyltransferase